MVKQFTNYDLTEMQRTPCNVLKEGLLVTFYVDDLIGFCKKAEILDNLETELEKKFKMKNLERGKQVLGIELDWSTPRSVYMQQTSLVTKLLATRNIRK